MAPSAYFYTIENWGHEMEVGMPDFDFQNFKQAVVDTLWSMGAALWHVDYDEQEP